MNIGTWVARFDVNPRAHTGRVLTKTHYVESVIEDEPITRCGRRLRKREGSEVKACLPVNACSECGYMLPPEDDATMGSITTLTVGNENVTLP
mgnify:CR=1 FL=1